MIKATHVMYAGGKIYVCLEDRDKNVEWVRCAVPKEQIERLKQ